MSPSADSRSCRPAVTSPGSPAQPGSPVTRSGYFDLLRALAIVRVVAYHCLGLAWLTIAFPAVGVMFALAGSLMAASLDRAGPAAVRRRLRRLLPPLWMLSAVCVPVMIAGGLRLDWPVLLWLFPVHDPPTNGWGAATLGMVWYVREYLWFVLLSPLVLPAFRRWPVICLLTPIGLLIAFTLTGVKPPGVLSDLALYGDCWLLGFAQHDGVLRRIRRSALLLAAGALAGLGACWFLTHPGPRGYDLNDIPLGNALWTMAFLLILLGWVPSRAAHRRAGRTLPRTAGRTAHRRAGRTAHRRAGRRAHRRAGRTRPWTVRLLQAVNSRVLTIYLWHQTAIGLTALAASRWRVDLSGPTGRLLLVTGVATLVLVAVAGFGWVEDLAARRRPSLRPQGGPDDLPVGGHGGAPPRGAGVDEVQAPAGGQRGPVGADHR